MKSIILLQECSRQINGPRCATSTLATSSSSASLRLRSYFEWSNYAANPTTWRASSASNKSITQSTTDRVGYELFGRECKIITRRINTPLSQDFNIVDGFLGNRGLTDRADHPDLPVTDIADLVDRHTTVHVRPSGDEVRTAMNEGHCHFNKCTDGFVDAAMLLAVLLRSYDEIQTLCPGLWHPWTEPESTVKTVCPFCVGLGYLFSHEGRVQVCDLPDQDVSDVEYRTDVSQERSRSG